MLVSVVYQYMSWDLIRLLGPFGDLLFDTTMFRNTANPSYQPSRRAPLDADGSIRMTDMDASMARLSAVNKGYMQDTFIKHLVQHSHLQPPRAPLINVGTYVRSAAIDTLVDSWISLCETAGKPCQIVSLGAGSDTRYWRIAVRFAMRSHLVLSNTHRHPARPVRTRRMSLNI